MLKATPQMMVSHPERSEGSLTYEHATIFECAFWQQIPLRVKIQE